MSSLLEIVTQYNAGLLNEAGAKAIIAAAFPGIPASTVNAIIAGTNTTPVVLSGDGPAPEPADPAPEPVAEEAAARAAPDAVDTGDFVSWGSGDGRGRGRITRVVRDGEIDVPDSSFTITGTEDDPAALIRVYRELAEGWSATDTLVGHRFSTLTKIDPLESRALGDIVEGDTVTWGDGLVGIVNHIMLTGTLNLGETEMEATPDDPAVLVSLVTDGEATNVQEAVKLAALTKVESNAYGYGKPKRKPRGRKRG